MSPPLPAPLAAASSLPPPPTLFPRNENAKNDGAALSGAAFLRRAASAGLVSVVVKQPPSAAPLLLHRAPSASSVFPSSSASSFAAADAPPGVAAFLPLAGLPAPSGLLRALSGEKGIPPQVELRLYRSDGSGALARALSSKESLARMASEVAAAAAAAAVAPAAPAAPAAVAAAPSSSSSAAVARALSRGSSAEVAAALLGCRLASGEEDEESGSPLSSSSSIKEKTTTGDDDDETDDDNSQTNDDASSLPALFLLPPPPGADAPPRVAHSPPYSIRKAGTEKTAEARVFVTAAEKNGRGNAVDVSPWHDLPLRSASSSSSSVPSCCVNMVVEIPRGTSAKFEVATSEEGTPIKQDRAKVKKKTKNDDDGAALPPAVPLLRHYALPISWNYGMLPRTFEDTRAGADEVYAAEEAKAGKGKAAAADETPPVPAAKDLEGDGDPLDAVELSETAFETGAVVPVRILGAFALIDEGQLDWKILCVAAAAADTGGEEEEEAPLVPAAAAAAAAPAHAPAAPAPAPIASLADLERAKPGEVERLVHWFSTYKKLEGGDEGAIGLGGKVLGASAAAGVVAEGERAYGRLVLSRKSPQQPSHRSPRAASSLNPHFGQVPSTNRSAKKVPAASEEEQQQK